MDRNASINHLTPETLSMPSFDIVSEVNEVEVRNAVEQANKEVGNRFDFKGSDARIEHVEKTLTLFADTSFQLDQVKEVLTTKLAKRSVDIRCLDVGDIQKISGNKVKRVVIVKTGIEAELAKQIIQIIKGAKFKVQASIQGDTVRISGAKRDVLQDTIALIRREITAFPLQYQNFRE